MNHDELQALLASLPKARMPADLRHAIEEKTIGHQPFYRRWFTGWTPPLIACAAALGAWMVFKHTTAKAELPIARVPTPTTIAVKAPDHPRVAMSRPPAREPENDCQDVPKGC